MSSPTWTLGELPLDKPNPARMYDYFLGGHHNFAIDRRAAEQLIAIYPDTQMAARAHRAFLRRAVSFLSSQGIDQFLDIGSGIPTLGNVHEIAQRGNPATHVVYVDSDLIAVAHSSAILKDVPNTVVIQADARQTAQLLAHPEIQRLLDFSRPVAILLFTLLHFITDDSEAHQTVRSLSDILIPGSYLALSHAANEHVPREMQQQGEQVYARSNNPLKIRTRAQIQAYFDGFELLAPGLVYVPSWHPEEPDDIFREQPERSHVFGGIARKP
jgi:S-adenosyl methyltransferase